MFDHFHEKPRRRRSRMALLLTLSITTHTAVVLVLLMVGMWQMERLVPPDRRIMMVQVGGLPMVERSNPPETERIKPREIRKRVIKETVQPHEKPADDENLDAMTAADGTGQGLDTGVGGTTGIGDGIGNGLGLDGPSIPITTLPPLPTPVIPPKRETNIPAQFLDGKRVAGDERIMPPDSVRVAMFRRDERRIDGAIKMCLDRDGRVSSLRVIKSTGYDVYDDKLVRGMKGWRYQPYLANGEAVGVCTAITWVYVMTD